MEDVETEDLPGPQWRGSPAHEDIADNAVWRSRPLAARLVRFAIVGIPFIVVVATAWNINRLLGPAANLTEALARWAALSVVSTIALIWVDRAAKRFLPLSALLHLSVVFPDAAPSRFKVALARGTTRQLARDVAAVRLDDATPQEAAEHLLAIVAQLTTHDRMTRGHTERVRAYADMVGEEMGLTEMERAKLHWGALIHDIGKLTVPTDILNKSTPLSDREWSRLKTHPNEGWKLAQPLRGWLGEWARAIRDHHERWDGGGYPRGLQGGEISRAGRIIAVADAYDVMTSARAYKQPMQVDAARAELARCAGSQFDPDVVRAFLALSFFERRRTGPLAWIANSPIALQISSVAQAPALATSALAAAISAGAVVAPALNPTPPEPIAQRVVEEVVTTTTTLPPVPTTTTTTSTTTSTTTTTTTSTTTTTTTTLPPATTTGAPVITAAPPTTTTQGVVAEVTTTTTTTSTTTTLPPSTFDDGYLGGPSGSTFSLVPGVSGTGATNWDPESDADPGVTISPDTAGLSEISSPNVRAWGIPITEDVVLDGQGSIQVYVATAGFESGTFGSILGGLVDCASGTTGCTTIGNGSALWSQSTFGGDFGVVTIGLGSINHTIAAGHQLLVTMAVPASVDRDVWVAFGSGSYPSRFRLV